MSRLEAETENDGDSGGGMYCSTYTIVALAVGALAHLHVPVGEAATPTTTRILHHLLLNVTSHPTTMVL